MQIPKTVFRTFSYFNEAGALPPRKCRRAATSGKRTELCFNEAGACHPGNDEPRCGRENLIPLASMRPERCHPGNLIRPADEDLWRAGFNEAGVLPPRKWAPATRVAARGRSFNEAGVLPPRKFAVQPPDLRVVRRASMRPECFHPGNSPFGTPCAA